MDQNDELSFQTFASVLRLVGEHGLFRIDRLVKRDDIPADYVEFDGRIFELDDESAPMEFDDNVPLLDAATLRDFVEGHPTKIVASTLNDLKKYLRGDEPPYPTRFNSYSNTNDVVPVYITYHLTRTIAVLMHYKVDDIELILKGNVADAGSDNVGGNGNDAPRIVRSRVPILFSDDVSNGTGAEDLVIGNYVAEDDRVLADLVTKINNETNLSLTIEHLMVIRKYVTDIRRLPVKRFNGIQRDGDGQWVIAKDGFIKMRVVTISALAGALKAALAAGAFASKPNSVIDKIPSFVVRYLKDSSRVFEIDSTTTRHLFELERYRDALMAGKPELIKSIVRIHPAVIDYFSSASISWMADNTLDTKSSNFSEHNCVRISFGQNWHPDFIRAYANNLSHIKYPDGSPAFEIGNNSAIFRVPASFIQIAGRPSADAVLCYFSTLLGLQHKLAEKEIAKNLADSSINIYPDYQLMASLNKQLRGATTSFGNMRVVAARYADVLELNAIAFAKNRGIVNDNGAYIEKLAPYLGVYPSRDLNAFDIFRDGLLDAKYIYIETIPGFIPVKLISTLLKSINGDEAGCVNVKYIRRIIKGGGHQQRDATIEFFVERCAVAAQYRLAKQAYYDFSDSVNRKPGDCDLWIFAAPMVKLAKVSDTDAGRQVVDPNDTFAEVVKFLDSAALNAKSCIFCMALPTEAQIRRLPSGKYRFLGLFNCVDDLGWYKFVPDKIDATNSQVLLKFAASKHLGYGAVLAGVMGKFLTRPTFGRYNVWCDQTALGDHLVESCRAIWMDKDCNYAEVGNFANIKEKKEIDVAVVDDSVYKLSMGIVDGGGGAQGGEAGEEYDLRF